MSHSFDNVAIFYYLLKTCAAKRIYSSSGRGSSATTATALRLAGGSLLLMFDNIMDLKNDQKCYKKIIENDMFLNFC